MFGKSLNGRVGIVVIPLLFVIFGLVLGSTFAPILSTKAAEPIMAKQQWEYLTAVYSQLPGNLPTDTPFAEFVQTNDPAYDQQLFGDLICAAKNPRDGTCRELLRGEAYYLNLWGNDGWELVNLINVSTSEIYRVEMVFERPR